MAILAVNTGSATIKFALYPLETETSLAAAVESGTIDGLPSDPAARQQQIDQLATRLTRAASHLGQPLQAVVHRVVHGGAKFSAPVRVTAEVLDQLRQLESLAPLHQPWNLLGIETFARAFPEVPQIAVFDTAFHTTLPELEQRYALAESEFVQGVRRYGFHGLSYAWLMQVLQLHSTRAQGRVLLAHLGSGASLCLALGGQSRATSMGFSALDGLMMGSRSGSLDPGIVLYWLERGDSVGRIRDRLYRESGLLGVSGESSDMRRLRQSTHPRAKRAIEMFEHRIVVEAGALAARCAGFDAVVFSGGIGENDAILRASVCSQLQWLGLELDPHLNANPPPGAQALHQASSRVEIWRIPTDEGRWAALQALGVLA